MGSGIIDTGCHFRRLVEDLMIFIFYFSLMLEKATPQTGCQRQQRVKYNNSLSRTLWLNNGVPQGLILGPMVFSILCR